jgi:hypothetical protein
LKHVRDRPTAGPTDRPTDGSTDMATYTRCVSYPVEPKNERRKKSLICSPKVGEGGLQGLEIPSLIYFIFETFLYTQLLLPGYNTECWEYLALQICYKLSLDKICVLFVIKF